MLLAGTFQPYALDNQVALERAWHSRDARCAITHHDHAFEVLLDAGDELPTKALLKHIEKAMGRKEASKARQRRRGGDTRMCAFI